MPTREEELIAITRTIESLRTKQRRIKRQLKAVQEDLRAEMRHRKGLMQAIEMERAPDIAPSRLTNGATGIKTPRRTKESYLRKPASKSADDFVEGL